MPIYLLRHGESEHNAKGYSGKDCSITEKGKIQASKIEGTFDIVICSTLKRAKQTLDHTKIKYKELYFSELCREIRKDVSDIKENESSKILGETYKELNQRAGEFKKLLKTYPKDKKILVVSHGIFLSELIGVVLKNCEMATYDPFHETCFHNKVRC